MNLQYTFAPTETLMYSLSAGDTEVQVLRECLATFTTCPSLPGLPATKGSGQLKKEDLTGIERKT